MRPAGLGSLSAHLFGRDIVEAVILFTRWPGQGSYVAGGPGLKLMALRGADSPAQG